MPEVGEYWYCAHGSAEVVRIVAADDEECTFVVVNSFVRPSFSIDDERLREVAVNDFLFDYEPRPAVSNSWLEEGSTWFARNDINARVRIDEEVDEDDETVAFREIRADGVGPVRRMSRAEFSQLYVLTDEDDDDHLTDERFWVIGRGICAAFVSRVDAQAFLYETSALLRLPEESLGIYVGHGLAVPQGMPGVGGLGGVAGTGGGSVGVGGSSGTMVVSAFAAERLNVDVIFPAGSFVMPARPPEPQQPQTLWERLTASDD